MSLSEKMILSRICEDNWKSLGIRVIFGKIKIFYIVAGKISLEFKF